MQLCIEMISFINHENESILRWFSGLFSRILCPVAGCIQTGWGSDLCLPAVVLWNSAPHVSTMLWSNLDLSDSVLDMLHTKTDPNFDSWLHIFSCLSLLSNISLYELFMPWMRIFTSHNLQKSFTAIFTPVFHSMVLFSLHTCIYSGSSRRLSRLTGTPMIWNFRPPPPPPHEKVNACQLCPSRHCLWSKAG